MLARLGRERRQGETRDEWLEWAVLSSVEELGGEWLRGAVIWTGRGHLGGDGVRQEVTRRGRAESRRVPRCAQVQQRACSAWAGRRRPYGAQTWRRTNAKWRCFSETLTLARCSEISRV